MWATRNTGAKEQEPSSMLTNFVPTSRDTTKIFKVNNEIHFTDDVTYETMHDLVKVLKETENDMLSNVAACTKAFVLSNDEKKTVDLNITPKPIILYLTTHGGSVYASLKVVDVIENLKVPVHTVVSGYVASAGTLLSLVGKKRYINKNSYMMIHELRSSFWGKYSDAREQLGNMDKLMATICNIIKSKSKISEENLKDILTRDRNWDANECLANGMVDEVC